jgi:hypothetical protein
MRKSQWPDFLFTIAVRFIVGIVLGGLACFLFTWRGILWAFSRNHTHGPFIWLGLCGFAGGVIGIFTVPRWQTPWYKKDPDELNVLTDLATQSPDWPRPESNVVKKTVRIKTVGANGEQHEYSSIEDVPPEIRSEIESLEKETSQEKGRGFSVVERSQQGNTFSSKIIQQKNSSVYKIVDESGTEQVYHSLEEMPPEIRAAFEEARKKLKE